MGIHSYRLYFASHDSGQGPSVHISNNDLKDTNNTTLPSYMHINFIYTCTEVYHVKTYVHMLYLYVYTFSTNLSIGPYPVQIISYPVHSQAMYRHCLHNNSIITSTPNDLSIAVDDVCGVTEDILCDT